MQKTQTHQDANRQTRGDIFIVSCEHPAMGASMWQGTKTRWVFEHNVFNVDFLHQHQDFQLIVLNSSVNFC